MATARAPNDLDDLLERWGDRILPVRLDVMSAIEARDAVAAAVECFERIDVVVNNAGKADLAAIEDCDETSFRQQLETVFMGWCMPPRLPCPYCGNSAGHFIQMLSAGGRMAMPSLAACQSAKRAVTGISDARGRSGPFRPQGPNPGAGDHGHGYAGWQLHGKATSAGPISRRRHRCEVPSGSDPNGAQ